MRPDGTIPRLNRALISDSAAAWSARRRHLDDDQLHRERVRRQGRRPHGTDRAHRRMLFLLALFIAPLAGLIPAYATAPALLYVACLMTRGLVEIEWNDITERPPP